MRPGDELAPLMMHVAVLDRHEQQEAALLAMEMSEDLEGLSMEDFEGEGGDGDDDGGDPVKQAARAAAKQAGGGGSDGAKGDKKGGDDEKALAAQMKAMLKGGGTKAEAKA